VRSCLVRRSASVSARLSVICRVNVPEPGKRTAGSEAPAIRPQVQAQLEIELSSSPARIEREQAEQGSVLSEDSDVLVCEHQDDGLVCLIACSVPLTA
jgi:hypothetical protein